MACTDHCDVEIKPRTNVILEQSSLAGVMHQWSGEALNLTRCCAVLGGPWRKSTSGGRGSGSRVVSALSQRLFLGRIPLGLGRARGCARACVLGVAHLALWGSSAAVVAVTAGGSGESRGAVSGVHLSPASPEIVLDHDHTSPSVGCLSSEPIIASPENTHADNSIGSQTIPKAQIQQSTHTHLDISLFPLGLTDEKSNGTIALVDDSEDPGANVSNIQLQQKISTLEMKLKVSEEEKQRIKKDVESLMEKHSILEKDFLKEKEQEAISFQDRYKELQEKHKQELEDMRKAGHEALSIIVDEYKALLQSSVKQQVEAIEKQYISAIEKQAHKCEELLNTQCPQSSWGQGVKPYSESRVGRGRGQKIFDKQHWYTMVCSLGCQIFPAFISQ
ncbi:TPA: coiled-coil domain containing 91, partial [Bos taurus]